MSQTIHDVKNDTPMTKHTSALAATLVAITALTPGQADATLYPSKFPVTEINGFFDPNINQSTARSLFAAGAMAAVGIANSNIIPNLTELALFSECQTKSPANNPWANGCSPAGLDDAMNTVFGPNQAWITLAWSVKASAINEMIVGLYQRKGPSPLPLFGQADNWGTVVKVDATLAPSIVLSKAWFFSACPSEGEDCFDGLFAASGAVFSTSFYLPLLDASITPSDPHYNRWPMLSGYSFQALVQPTQPDDLTVPPKVQVEPGTPVLEPNERLTPALAGEIVFDALDLEGLLDDPSLAKAVAHGVADEGRLVRGRLASGEAWNYVLVPIVDPDSDEVLAMVALSERGGAFEFIKVPTSARAMTLRSPEEAATRASAQLRSGERLGAPRLEWSAKCDGESACRSPDAPSFVFAVTAAGARVPHRRIVVPLGQSSARVSR